MCITESLCCTPETNNIFINDAVITNRSLKKDVSNMISEVAQTCSTLCDPMDCSLPGSSVREIFQARALECIAISSPGDLSDPGIKSRSPALQADSLPSEPPEKPLQHDKEHVKNSNMSLNYL